MSQLIIAKYDLEFIVAPRGRILFENLPKINLDEIEKSWHQLKRLKHFANNGDLAALP